MWSIYGEVLNGLGHVRFLTLTLKKPTEFSVETLQGQKKRFLRLFHALRRRVSTEACQRGIANPIRGGMYAFEVGKLKKTGR
jgi:hypothetical protein